MNLSDFYRKKGTFLTPIDQHYALIDQDRERIIILNETAAWIWSRLGSDTAAPIALRKDAEDFIATLDTYELLAPTSPESENLEPLGRVNGKPAVLKVAPLQVAAANSTDPFDLGW